MYEGAVGVGIHLSQFRENSVRLIQRVGLTVNALPFGSLSIANMSIAVLGIASPRIIGPCVVALTGLQRDPLLSE